MTKRLYLITTIILLLSFIYLGCTEKPFEPNTTRLVVTDIPQIYVAPFGGPSPNQFFFYLTSTSEKVLNYRVSKKTNWLQLINSSQSLNGVTPDSVLFSIRVATPITLPYGTYYDTIVIKTDSIPQATIYKEIVLHIGTEIITNPTNFEFIGNVDGTNPNPQSLEINSTSVLQFDVSISKSASWLQLPITSYSTDDTDMIPLSINTSGLPRGVYVDTIWISGDSALNSPHPVPVTLNVVPWLSQESPWKSNINDVYFSDTLQGWAVGDIIGLDTKSGFILKTIDGGINWVSVRFLPGETLADSILSGITFRDNVGWISGGNGIIMQSNDNGDNWVAQNRSSNMNIDYKDIFFISDDSGWVVGDSGIVLATSDGGDNWIIQDVPRNALNDSLKQVLTGISFTDNLHGWVSGLTNIILFTSDGGQTWEQQVVPSSSIVGNSYDFQEITFVDNLHGWAIGKSGILISTVDGGTTWTSKQLQQNKGLLSVSFANASLGWISGHNGVLYHTTNGGTDWTEQIIETTSSLQSIYFYDNTHGWVVGGDGAIFRTTSGGE